MPQRPGRRPGASISALNRGYDLMVAVVPREEDIMLTGFPRVAVPELSARSFHGRRRSCEQPLKRCDKTLKFFPGVHRANILHEGAWAQTAWRLIR